MKQAIARIQSASATMKTFSLETEDKQAKAEFEKIARQLDDTLEVLKGRQNYIESQEPQYK